MQIEKQFHANIISKVFIPQGHMKFWKLLSRKQMTQAVYRAFLFGRFSFM